MPRCNVKKILTLSLLALFGISASANDFATNFGTYSARDRAPQGQPDLTIRKIFIFPGHDDVGNVVAPELDAALAKKLERNSRFQVIHNPKVADALRMDDRGYGKVAASPEVHSKAARLAGADTTVVLDAKHVGQGLQIKEDWRRADGSLLFSETQTIGAKSGIDEQKRLVTAITDTVIGRIPFRGSITGRTGNTITLDLNQDQVSVGDKLKIARVVSTKEHPLLKTLVNIDYVNVGSAEVTSTDNVLSFAKITGESSGEEISTEQKIIGIDRFVGSRAGEHESDVPREAAPEWNKLEKYEKQTKDPLENQEKLGGEFEKTKARYGSLGARLLAGNIGHSESKNGTTAELSGFGFGAGVSAEIWVTKNWLGAISYDFLSSDIKGQRAGVNVTETGTSWNKFDFYAAYRYLTDGTLEGTFVTFGLGYESIHMNMPLDATNELGKKSYGGVLLQIIGDIALDSNNRVEASLGLQPFSSLTETEFTSGSAQGASAVNAGAKWLMNWKTNLYVTLGLDYNVANGSLSGGKNLTEKRFSISPGLKYSF